MGRDKLVPPLSGVIMPRVLVITGAGISAESGIPTFRGKQGYWRNLDPAKLATPEAFAADPTLVWEWYRQRRATIRRAQPNAAHIAVTRLASHCTEFLLVTQNVDNLHVRAQYQAVTLPAHHIVQIHGDIFLTLCSQCAFQYHELENDQNDVPLCPDCGGMMRPGVVWFGETLDPERIAKVETFLTDGRVDVVLVIGTTAMFGYIVDWAVRAANAGGRLIEINPDATTLSGFVAQSIRKPAGEALPDLVDELLKPNG
jgi:NAD-dependent deacetylase